MQRLAMEETIITIGDYRFVLRPTLRAAARLEQIYDGWGQLATAYTNYEFKALADIVVESSDDPNDAFDRLCKAVGQFPLGDIYKTIQSSIARHIGRLVGYDPDATEVPTEQPVSFTEYHEALFKIGTGWLGWTPEQTWNATPKEIIVARAGLIDKLRAIHAPTQSDTAPANEITKEEFKALSSKRIGERV